MNIFSYLFLDIVNQYSFTSSKLQIRKGSHKYKILGVYQVNNSGLVGGIIIGSRKGKVT